MSIINFTVEEINLIAIYKSDSKDKTLFRINDMFEFMDEDMQVIATSAASKLSEMTNDEFVRTEFIPAEYYGGELYE
jgi:hypothetical protein